jgi:hypothetical protein
VSTNRERGGRKEGEFELTFDLLACVGSFVGLARPSKSALADKKRKEEARIDGAAEVAIGIKKDGDFAEWYKRVSSSFAFLRSPPLRCCSPSRD